ncbi:ATPase associated with various cellular activities AAA_5 [Rhizobium sp. CF080]|uniref:AAA family ATPase n=1 Tax=Rhizobium sp. (strain CF080) TaxID=1144310 RepID=UPI000271ACE5|nr:AAA family ATPase [Rhizobium sp. CF080]EUB97279.1 ATPase associated with various cellular activities AAA_5 [Rhizobium sp. CF080]
MHIKTAALNLNDYLDEDTPAFMWGPPGCGKSQATQQIADSRGWNLIDFRASTRDSVALMGLPDISGDTTKWKVPDEFPQVERDGPEGILFLDELNAAPPSMMAAMFGLVLDRKVGDYVLPKGWRVVAAGNRQTDRAAAQRMPTALANRFAHIDVEADTSAGHDNVHVEHFNKIGMDPIMIAFLRFRPHLIHKMPESSDDRAFPTPRSWEQAAKYIGKDSSRRLSLVSGVVGDGAAGELEGFIRVYQKLPSLDLVLANPNSAPLPDDPSARFAISAALGRRADAKTFENAMTYIRRIPAREFEIMMAVDAVRRDPGLSHTQTFTDWAVRNQDVTLG